MGGREKLLVEVLLQLPLLLPLVLLLALLVLLMLVEEVAALPVPVCELGLVTMEGGLMVVDF